jgi:hypothetical protein
VQLRLGVRSEVQLRNEEETGVGLHGISSRSGDIPVADHRLRRRRTRIWRGGGRNARTLKRFGAARVVFDGDRNVAAPWRTGCAADKRMTQAAFDQSGHEIYSALVAIVLKNREQVEPNENLFPRFA